MKRVKAYRIWGIILVVFAFLIFLTASSKSGGFIKFISNPTRECPIPFGGFFNIIFNLYIWTGICLFWMAQRIEKFVQLKDSEDIVISPSIGVIVFGVLGVISGVQSLLVSIFKLNTFDVLTVFTDTSSVILIVLTINILRLKEWARKGIIYYSIITTLISPIWIKNSAMRVHLSTSMNPKNAVLFGVIAMGMFTFLILYFFTRPKVKAQFK